MTYYKIIRGYGAEDFIRIDETELEKANYAFLAKKDAIYSGGSVRGSEILAIQPDYHRIMGWNTGYKLGVDDFAELRAKGIEKKCLGLLSSSKEKVQYLISTKQENLIGRNVAIPELEKKNPVSKEIESLADKMKIK